MCMIGNGSHYTSWMVSLPLSFSSVAHSCQENYLRIRTSLSHMF